ncbi:hypothetical protein F5884DRAFT_902314 [Xylogone sp. PMI_703]|nr:hypothetical protein F5884DRAFT_902314 [Xylogone sp. PMI_703]
MRTAEPQDGKTTYVLARATLLTGVQRIFTLEPQLLLQLQELSYQTRPLPVIDVLTSNNFTHGLSQKSTLMGERRKTQRGREILVLKSSREALAMIVELDRGGGEAEIYLAGGSDWKATRLSNGSFEFTTENQDPNKPSIAQWRPVILAGHDRESAQRSGGDGSVSLEEEYRFNVVHPQLRRRPVLASLTRSRLDITNRCKPFTRSFVSPGDELPDTSKRHYAPTKEDGNLEILIKTTRIWVSLCFT